MRNIKEDENLIEYAENYFNSNEDFYLRPNHRAEVYPELRDRMISTDLNTKLEWVRKSESKKRYGDPFQTSLFESFTKDDLAKLLIVYDPKDIKKYIDAKLFEKMPRNTMLSLFLYKDAIDSLDNRQLDMLATNFAIYNQNVIYDFITQNDDKIPEALFDSLFRKIQDPDLVDKIDYEYGEPVSIWEQLRSPKGR